MHKKELKVKLKSKEQLQKLGYEPNDDPNDFYNLMSDKTVTLDLCNSFYSLRIYTCKEFPDYAIYVEHIDDNLDALLKNSKRKEYTQDEICKLTNTNRYQYHQIVDNFKSLISRENI